MEELDVAVAIAREAGEIALSYFRTDHVEVRAKGERDVVTAADTASERHVLDRLRAAFPRDGVVGEEGASEPAAGSRCWYIDPLDGTLNYSRGLPIWCVSLALFDAGQPVLGVIYDPTRAETFTAVAGDGALLDGKPLSCGGTTTLAEAMVHLTIDFNEASLWAGLDDIREIAPRVLRTRNIGSAALALSYVAAGHFDAMIHRFANPWDYGAGVLLIREAGGQVTQVDGAGYRVESTAVLAAATPALHAELLTLIRGGQSTRVE